LVFDWEAVTKGNGGVAEEVGRVRVRASARARFEDMAMRKPEMQYL